MIFVNTSSLLSIIIRISYARNISIIQKNSVKLNYIYLIKTD